MKKFKLEITDLKVDSFETAKKNSPKGTVNGLLPNTFNCSNGCTAEPGNESCGGTCGNSDYGTCYDTCWGPCGVTNNPEEPSCFHTCDCP